MAGVSSLGLLIAYSSVIFAVKVLPGRAPLSSPWVSAWRREFGWTEADTLAQAQARQPVRQLCPDAYDQVGARPMFCFATACKLLLWAEYAYEINMTAGQGGGEQCKAGRDNSQPVPGIDTGIGACAACTGSRPGCTSPPVEPAAASQGVPGVPWGSWLRQARGREEGGSSDTSSCAATVKGARTGAVTGAGLSQDAGGGGACFSGGGEARARGGVQARGSGGASVSGEARVGGSEDKSGERHLLLLQLYDLHELEVVWERGSDIMAVIAWSSCYSRILISFRGTVSARNAILDLQAYQVRGRQGWTCRHRGGGEGGKWEGRGDRQHICTEGTLSWGATYDECKLGGDLRRVQAQYGDVWWGGSQGGAGVGGLILPLAHVAPGTVPPLPDPPENREQ